MKSAVLQKEALIRGANTALFLMIALLGTTAQSQTPQPLGGELQINTYTTGSQVSPMAVAGAQGDFLVVWSSYGSGGTDDSSSSIQGQRFDSNGLPIGGDFLVVCESRGSAGTDNSTSSIQGRRYGTLIFANGVEFGDIDFWSGTQ